MIKFCLGAARAPAAVGRGGGCGHDDGHYRGGWRVQTAQGIHRLPGSARLGPGRWLVGALAVSRSS